MIRGFIRYNELVNQLLVPPTTVRDGINRFRKKETISWKNTKINNFGDEKNPKEKIINTNLISSRK